MAPCFTGMTKNNYILILLILGVVNSKNVFSEQENEIIISILNHFHIKFCLYLDESEKGGVINFNATFPARQNVFTSILSSSTIQEFMNDENYQNKYSGMSLVVIRESDESLEKLKKMSRKIRMGEAAAWLFFSRGEFRKELFKDIYIPFDCQFMVINSPSVIHRITEVYNVAEDSALLTNNFGYWSVESGLVTSQPDYLYTRRKTLNNHEFEALTRHNPPYTRINRTTNPTTFSGYFIETWRELEFRIKFKTVFPTKYQNLDENEIKKIMMGGSNVQFDISNNVFEKKVFDFMDISEPIYNSKLMMFGRRPSTELEWNSYLKPFSTNTWIVNLVWMIVSSIALAILYKVAWEQNTTEREEEFFIFTWEESFATVFRALCMQGSETTPRSCGCRIMFLSIYLTALVVTAAFSAALFSLLTIHVPKPPFDTHESVLDTWGYKIGMIPDTSNYERMQALAVNNSNSVHKRLMDLVERKERLPKNVSDALHKVCRSKSYIFLWDMASVLEELRNLSYPCMFEIMPGAPPLESLMMGFGLKKGSPYKEIINYHIRRMKNEGILFRLHTNNWPEPIPTVALSWVRVTLQDITPLLYMFGIGALLGLCIMLAENFYKYCSNSRMKKTKTDRGLKQAWENGYGWQNESSSANRDTNTNYNNYSQPDDWNTKYWHGAY